jgi:hypothetical protein
VNKIIAILLIVTLNSLASCGLMGTYDNVELMIGLQVPVYETNVNFGLHMILKDQAINKIKEGERAKLVDAQIQILRWKHLKESKNGQ